ncbi:MAG: hypothetical protein SGPRY_014425, partial [Prymnesium sp.]
LSLSSDLVLWTSASKTYAHLMVEKLDPHKSRFISVLTRESCSELELGLFTKDLSLLGRPLERVVLLDDSVTSFLMQPYNAIPMTPYFGGADDRGLPAILPMLRGLERQTDVRNVLREEFKMQEHLRDVVNKLESAT